MKKNTTNAVDQTNTDNIDQMARSATAGTLKRIYNASANDNIRKFRQNLQRDFSIIDNNLTDNLSDAYDLYTLSYSYLYEKIIVNGLTDQTSITITLKNGTKKTRTVYQWACALVRKEIYSNKSIESNGKYIYLEDLKQSDTDNAELALDREYIRLGKYSGLGGDTDYGIITRDNDYERYNELLKTLDLTKPQYKLLAMRMQGLSTTAIGKKLNVSQQAISKQLVKIQAITAEKCPDLVRYFKEQRNH